MNETQFVFTSGGISHLAECSQQFICKLALAGLLPHVTSSNGTRLYPEEAAQIARKIKAESLARRWRRAA
jgi:hypothetical protein